MPWDRCGHWTLRTSSPWSSTVVVTPPVITSSQACNTAVRGQNPNGQNPNGQNPNGQNPSGQNPNGQNPNRTKSQRTKSQPLVLDVGVQTFLIYTCMHGSCIHTYYHHAELLDAPYTIMLFWFILLLTETLILTIWCQSGICRGHMHLTDLNNL